jgi:hypothetical protein
MRSNLIYLHIEKSAGTSQRTLFWANYGRENVAWSGLDSSRFRQRDILRFLDRPVLGGHLDFELFESLQRHLLFTAVVRDPLDRAISLFYYFAHNAPREQREGWRRRGLDPDSMVRTLDQCEQLRRELRDAQCRRLGGGGSFDMVRRRLETANFMVGVFEAVDDFNRQLGSLLSWHTVGMGKYNSAGRPGYQAEIRRESGLIDRLSELTAEDRRLYEFIRQVGGWVHLPDAMLFKEHLSVDSAGRQPQEAQDASDDIVISVVGDNGIDWRGDIGKLEVGIVNRGRAPVSAAGPDQVMLGYHWLDGDGEIIEEGLRTPLPYDLAPDESVVVSAKVKAPRDGAREGRWLRFSMLAVGRHWLVSIDRNHAVWVQP